MKERILTLQEAKLIANNYNTYIGKFPPGHWTLHDDGFCPVELFVIVPPYDNFVNVFINQQFEGTDIDELVKKYRYYKNEFFVAGVSKHGTSIERRGVNYLLEKYGLGKLTDDQRII